MARRGPRTTATLSTGPACLACSRRDQACGGGIPCSACARLDHVCSYAQPPSMSSPWSEIDLRNVARYPEPLLLARGAEGFARLAHTRTKRRKFARFDWEPVVEQREDVRIRQHPLYPPAVLAPGNGRRSAPADSHSPSADKDLLDAAKACLPFESLHPTILLHSILHARPPSSTAPDSAQSRRGNALSVSSSSLAAGGNGTSHAVWARTDPVGNRHRIAFGEFLPAPPVAPPDDAAPRLDSTPNSTTLVRWSHPSHFRPFPLFSPTSFPVATYDSPVLALHLAPLAPATTSLLAVRTRTSVALLHANLKSPTMSLSHTRKSETVLATFEYAGRELGRRPLADVVLGGVGGGELGSGMIADVDGGLWGWGLGVRGTGRVGDGDWTGGRPEMFRLRRGRRGLAYDGLVSIGYGGSRGLDAVIAMDDEVLLYDLRSPRASSSLVDLAMLSRCIPYGPDQSPSIVTSLATPSPRTQLRPSSSSLTTPTSIHTVCTTRDIIWLDDRMPGRDLMRWAHGRTGRGNKGLDTTLGLMHIGGDVDVDSGDSIERVVLHSRLQPLLSIHTYSTNPSEPPRSLLDPYTLSSPSSDPLWTRTGLAIVPATSELTHAARADPDELASESGWLIIESGTDGALLGRYTTLRDYESSDALDVRFRRKWTADVCESAKEFVDSQGEASAPPIDLSRTLAKVFRDPVGREEGDDAMATRLEQAADAMRRQNAASEGDDVGILTLYDLLAISPEHGHDHENAPALPSLPRPSTFVRVAAPFVEPGSLPVIAKAINAATESLTDPVEWSSLLLRDEPRTDAAVQESLRPNPTAKWSHMQRHSRELARRYGVCASEPGEPPSAATQACEQVVLDTAAASRLFSLRPVDLDPPALYANTPHPPHLEPPALHFAYFRPRADAPDPELDDEDADDAWKRKSLESAGVRLLLGEWNVGANPDSYAWTNPYRADKHKATAAADEDDDGAPPLSRRKKPARDLVPASVPLSLDPFRPREPSQLSGARRIHPIQEEPPSSEQGAASQPVGRSFAPPTLSSQSWAGAASQVLPGAFGGRPVAGAGDAPAKKRAKKRVSGF